MDREILFRGKRMDNEEWVYGYLYITHNGEHEISRYCEEVNIERWTAVVAPSTVGQYTGLTDKNGVKIFEWDIVRYNDQVDFDIHAIIKIGEYAQDGSDGEYVAAKCIGVHCEVIDFTRPYWAEEIGVSLRDCDNTVSPLDQDVIGLEVIGNVYDNPELLTGDTNK